LKSSGQQVEPEREPELRYAYYRRCQMILRNGEQCRCPAQKGSDTCRNHAEQKEMAERRMAQKVEVMGRAAEKMSQATGWRHAIEDVFLSRRGVQAAINEAALALIENRLDEKGAKELLVELQSAMGVLRAVESQKPVRPFAEDLRR
jgi:hypothetical protein